MSKQLYRDVVEMHLSAFGGGLIRNRREDDIVDTFFHAKLASVDAARVILKKRA